jgi:P-type E1-E2 ATPase
MYLPFPQRVDKCLFFMCLAWRLLNFFPMLFSGCVNVICSDKTGTITCNQMTVTAVITACGDRVQVP